ncbi:MAG: Spy/CpxP family protein refolding chaperone [Thermoanaerobaculia bacterium]
MRHWSRPLTAVLISLALCAPASALTKMEALHLFDRVAAKLQLTTEQRSEIFFLLARNQKDIRGLLNREDAARMALREAIAQPEYDEALVRDRSCNVADAELAVSLLAAKLYSDVSKKLDDDQQKIVSGWVGSIPVKDALLSAATEAADGKELFLTIHGK